MAAVGWGWRKLAADPLPWIAIMVITLALGSAVRMTSGNLGSPPTMGVRLDFGAPDGWRTDWWWGVAAVGSSILGVAFGVLSTVIQWLLTAWAYCAAPPTSRTAVGSTSAAACAGSTRCRCWWPAC